MIWYSMTKTILISSFIIAIAVMMVLSSLPVSAFTLTGDDGVPDLDARGHGTVTICHVTGSTSNPVVLITVSAHAAPAHIAHGDFSPNAAGSCVRDAAG